MKLLAFSDLHRDLSRAASLAEASSEADVVIGAGDFASVHEGLDETIAALASITKPVILVPGNNETEAALRAAVTAAGWESAQVLHGEATVIAGQATFFGLGGGIPTTPWDWSFDLTEDEAARALAPVPEQAVLVVHSPPRGHCDEAASGQHLGSEAIASAITERRPALVVCGHIHESWGARSTLGTTPVANLGPDGAWFEL